MKELHNLARQMTFEYDPDFESHAATTLTASGVPETVCEVEEQTQTNFLAELQTCNKIQELERKIEELIKHKDSLEIELNEFKDDLNASLMSVSHLNKRLTNYIKQHSPPNVDSNHSVDHNHKPTMVKSSGYYFCCTRISLIDN